MSAFHHCGRLEAKICCSDQGRSHDTALEVHHPLDGGSRLLERPWSCGVVLGGIPFEGSPHSRFDYHGMGLLLAWATTLILSPLAWILIKRGSEQLPSLSGVDAGSAGVVFVVLLFLGTPLFSQFAYLSALPLALSWPVLTSSAVWFAIASYLCPRVAM